MNEETSVVDPKKIEELQRRLAGGANERTDTFSTMPTITVSNEQQDAGEGKSQGIAPGEIVSSVKTENGYQNETFQNPFKGVVLRQRMFLRSKLEAQKNGAPKLISDEFDSYADSEMITMKKQNLEGKWEVDFVGNYKQVVAKYSDTNQFGKVNKYLDLQYNLYVCVSLSEKKVVKVMAKGMSRGALFDFMKTFTRRNGDFMSTTWIKFSTQKHLTNSDGEPLKFPVYSFAYEKDGQLDYQSLVLAEQIQTELNKAMSEREAAFASKRAELVANSQVSPEELPQGEIAEELPTINLDEDTVEEAPIKIEEPPFN